MELTMYHNPRCTKSKQVLKMIEESGLSCNVIEYLNAPPTEEQLAKIYLQLGTEGKKMIRTHEEEFRKFDVNLDSPESIAQAIAQVPKLMERPIVIRDSKAVIGRPPERVEELLV